jgi:hypothetical protein
MPGLFDPGSFRANGFPRTDISGISSIAPVLTNKDATGWIRVSEKTSSRQLMDR